MSGFMVHLNGIQTTPGKWYLSVKIHRVNSMVSIQMFSVGKSIYNQSLPGPWSSMSPSRLGRSPAPAPAIDPPSLAALSLGGRRREDNDEVGDSDDDRDGEGPGNVRPNPFTLVPTPFGRVLCKLGPFLKPTRAIARRSISPDASRAMRNLASSAHNSQSPCCVAMPIRRTTESSTFVSWPSSSSSSNA